MKTLKKIYSLRQSFSVIGLTGRTGAGVSRVAHFLSQNFSDIKDIQGEKKVKELTDIQRKYNMSYNFSATNWKKYKVIEYKDILLLHLIRCDINKIKLLLDSYETFKNDSDRLIQILVKNNDLLSKINNIGKIDKNLKSKKKLKTLSKIFFKEREFKILSDEFNNNLKKLSIKDRISFFNLIANNLRKSGDCINGADDLGTHIYTIVESINKLIKVQRNKTPENTHIVIDSLRNSLEIMYFKERYSAFYMFSINSEHRRSFLMKKYNDDKKIVDDILNIDIIEYEGKGVSKGEFYIQDVQNCIQLSDVHFNYNPSFEFKNKDYSDKEKLKEACDYYIIGQIIRYTSLILHPGLITPSAQERCMQIAYNAKSNSGCISRQVGAVVADRDFSIKAIGWNDVPSNVTPCIYRNVNSLKLKEDVDAYTPYELDESHSYNSSFKKYYKDINENYIDGLSCSFCFKDFQNLYEKKDNQVHTRSLHAEENAMLQISKYGGQSLKNGILFTTASPCELCSKKARQLEITQIYYIDPYPGISEKHILQGGKIYPELILFVGAVGSAYHKLYNPIMSHKDELALITGLRPKQDFKNNFTLD